MPSSKRLKIVHILFSRGFAGTERSTAESCNSQCNAHDIVLVCSKRHQRRKSGASILNHLDPRVKVIQVSPGLFLQSRLQKIIDAENPDITHAHLRKSTRLISKCKTNAAKISTLHIGVNSPQFLNMDALIAISPWQLNNVPKAFKGELRWIRNSLTPHPHPTEERVEQLKKELEVNESQFVVGGIGRLSSSKGWETLIKAFHHANIPNSVLIIIGEGREKDKLIKQASNFKIDFRVEDYKHLVKDYYATFDVFVCPSKEEPMGRVVLEALDSGVPVIASNIEGPKDILSEYPGTLFPVNDYSALASALQQAYRNSIDGIPNVRPDLSLHYVDKVNESMLELYADTIEKKRSGLAV